MCVKNPSSNDRLNYAYMYACMCVIVQHECVGVFLSLNVCKCVSVSVKCAIVCHVCVLVCVCVCLSSSDQIGVWERDGLWNKAVAQICCVCWLALVPPLESKKSM